VGATFVPDGALIDIHEFADRDQPRTRVSTIGRKVRQELRELVPATLYLVVTFNIIGFTKYLLLRDYGINVSTFASSTILALLAAKAMAVADALPFMEPFRPRPIVRNVLWKTSVYLAAVLAVQLLETRSGCQSTTRASGRCWRCCGRRTSGWSRSGWRWCCWCSAPSAT
jgi:hypothetical protein